jgi:hypothetical protein
MNGIPWWFNWPAGNKLAPKARWREVRPERGLAAVAKRGKVALLVVRCLPPARSGIMEGGPHPVCASIVDLVSATGGETTVGGSAAISRTPTMSNNLCSLTALRQVWPTTTRWSGFPWASSANPLPWRNSAGPSNVSVEQSATRPRRRGAVETVDVSGRAGRQILEIDGLLGQTQTFAREHGIATPVIDVCLPLLRGGCVVRTK